MCIHLCWLLPVKSVIAVSIGLSLSSLLSNFLKNDVGMMLTMAQLSIITQPLGRHSIRVMIYKGRINLVHRADGFSNTIVLATFTSSSWSWATASSSLYWSSSSISTDSVVNKHGRAYTMLMSAELSSVATSRVFYFFSSDSFAILAEDSLFDLTSLSLGGHRSCLMKVSRDVIFFSSSLWVIFFVGSAATDCFILDFNHRMGFESLASSPFFVGRGGSHCAGCFYVFDLILFASSQWFLISA